MSGSCLGEVRDGDDDDEELSDESWRDVEETWRIITQLVTIVRMFMLIKITTTVC